MKGSIKVTIEVKDDCPLVGFPITSKWLYERDNTFETIDEWIDLFNNILCTQGFSGVSLTINDEE